MVQSNTLYMIIECHKCESKVDAKVLAQKTFPGEDYEPYCISFLECPICNEVLVGSEDYIGFHDESGKDEWGAAFRQWPSPDTAPDWKLPASLRQSLSEASKCFKAAAYDACAVMCGKALENICAEHGVKNQMLAGGLKELLDKEIIDKKIFEWGKALRQHRNTAAHASDARTSKQDARYLLDFANAISDYVFTLTAKFDEFMKTKTK